jgi:hypothetical protein
MSLEDIFLSLTTEDAGVTTAPVAAAPSEAAHA